MLVLLSCIAALSKLFKLCQYPSKKAVKSFKAVLLMVNQYLLSILRPSILKLVQLIVFHSFSYNDLPAQVIGHSRN